MAIKTIKSPQHFKMPYLWLKIAYSCNFQVCDSKVKTFCIYSLISSISILNVSGHMYLVST